MPWCREPPEGVAVYPHAVGAVRCCLWPQESHQPLTDRNMPVSEGRRSGVPHALTPRWIIHLLSIKNMEDRHQRQCLVEVA
jgi:hypothetical protein